MCGGKVRFVLVSGRFSVVALMTVLCPKPPLGIVNSFPETRLSMSGIIDLRERHAGRLIDRLALIKLGEDF